MNTIKKIFGLFKKPRLSGVPVFIIKRENDEENIMEFDSIEEAIADLEKDPNVSQEKIEKLKESIKKLKDRTSIKIKNGEII